MTNTVIFFVGAFLVLMILLLWALAKANSSGREKSDQEQEAFIKKYNSDENKPEQNPGTSAKKKLQHWQIIAVYLLIYDVIAVNAAYFLALWVRFDCMYSHIPKDYLAAYLKFAPIYTVVSIAVFWMLRLYKSVWRFASYSELLRITAATAFTGIFHLLGITLVFHRMPISYYLFGIMLQFLLTVGIRFSYRFILLERSRKQSAENGEIRHRVMIIGAGAAGQTILRELLRAQETPVKVCCIIDDNSNKWDRYIEGIPIVGGREDILLNVKKYRIDQILLAIPSASAEEKRDILNICKETGCELKILPGIYQLVNGEVSLSKMKDVAVEDLLGREPIKVNLDEIFRHLSGKTILVTGGGGSIGSELCRQIAGHNPGHLIIFDVYENNAYDIEQELKGKYPELHLTVLIGSVRDSRRVNSVFETYKPDIVYHAAAHKHVPLMETSPCEAIKNNVIGTYKTAYAALKNGCERFVLISTDKAVNPTNIMGASKRLCEMVVQSMDRISRQGKEEMLPMLSAHYEDDEELGAGSVDGSLETAGSQDKNIKNVNDNRRLNINGLHTNSSRKCMDNNRKRTEFVAVRFGNVLGSNGSVIPLFKKQIEKGGPVTVTHPDIIRYFMTIPEAVSLVLQAGTYAKGGEIFVLDMGAPVKIDTLARNLIKLSGYKPDVDIRIVYTGLRPGEKLYEEKLMEEEGMGITPNQLIHIGKPIPFDVVEFLGQLEELAAAAYRNREDIRKLVKGIVSTYHSANDDLLEERENYRRVLGEVALSKVEG
ncbi:polysaccharide biosynthesis protein [Blautia schinkii]|nr:polysaccharide biosynthesis protein [Blautia schinkii]